MLAGIWIPVGVINMCIAVTQERYKSTVLKRPVSSTISSGRFKAKLTTGITHNPSLLPTVSMVKFH